MKRINALLLLNLSLPSLSLAQNYDDINFNEYLNKSGYKYFSKFYSKKIKDDVKDPIYQEYFDSIYILNSIQLDNEQEFLRIEQLIQKSKIKNNHLLLEIAQKYEEKENFNKALELYNQLSSSDDEINLKRVYLNILQENFDVASNILKRVSDKFEKEKTYIQRLLTEIENKQYQIMGDYICEVIAELPFSAQERDMFLRLQVPVKLT